MRIAVVVGWLAGVCLVLAGYPWPLGCLGPAAGAGTVLAWRRWIGDPRVLWQLARDLTRLRKNVDKIVKERAVERA